MRDREHGAPGSTGSGVAVAARRLAAEGGVQVAPPVVTPWGDIHVRICTPDGRQLTPFSTPSTAAQ